MYVIDKLTKKQEEQLISHREEYLKWGLCTDRIDIPLAKSSISNIYKQLLKREINSFWICDSPLMCNLIIALFVQNLRPDIRLNLWQDLSRKLVKFVAIEIEIYEILRRHLAKFSRPEMDVEKK